MHPVEGVCFAAVSVHPPRGAQISFQLQGPPHCNSASAYKQPGPGYPPEWRGLASFLTQGQTAPADSGVAMGYRTKEMQDCETTEPCRNTLTLLTLTLHPCKPSQPTPTHPYTPTDPHTMPQAQQRHPESKTPMQSHNQGLGPAVLSHLSPAPPTPQPLEVQEDLTHTVPHSL